MQITNHNNIAPEIYEAICARAQRYEKGDAEFSVTQLIDSPRVVQLEKRYEDEIVVDVCDLFDSWNGHLFHDALERDNTSRRICCDVAGVSISGAYDYFHEGTLKDYKRTSVWNVKLFNPFDKWAKQTNLYAALLRREGQKVKEIYIEAIFKDWNEMERRRVGGDYPKCQFQTYHISVWPADRAEMYLQHRTELHQHAASRSDNMLPFCTPEERWAKETTWAAMKKDRKSAVRVFKDGDTKGMDAFAEKNKIDGENMWWEERKGENVRCERFCTVRKWCNQYREMKNDC